MSDEEQASNPEALKWLPVGTGGLAVLLAWGMWAMENFAGRTIKGRLLEAGDDPVGIWMPLIATPVILVVCAIWFMRVRHLTTQGVRVQGTITGFGVIGMKQMRNVSFTYTYEGKTFEKKSSMHKTDIKEMSEGDTINLMIDPDKPDRFVIV